MHVAQNLSHPNGAAQRGSYVTEMAIVFPVFVFLVLACIQLGLIYQAKTTLSYAAFEAAREGSMSNGRALPVVFTGLKPSGVDIAKGSVLQGLIRGLFPLYPSDASATSLMKGYAKAAWDVSTNSCIEFLQPTQAAFLDWGFIEKQGRDEGIIQIPNDSLRYRKPLAVDLLRGAQRSNLEGVFSGYSVQEANVLKLKVRYAYEPRLPFIGRAIVSLARAANTTPDGFEARAYANGRLPMEAIGTVRMQTPVHWHPFFPLGFMPESNASWNYDESGNIAWQEQFAFINALRSTLKFSDESFLAARLPMCLNPLYYFGSLGILPSLPDPGLIRP